MPQLQEHQLRVAAVAKLICQNFDGHLNRSEVIAACLLHDMGNIIKFDLTKTQELFGSSWDKNYWQAVKREYLAKYGSDEHRASVAIAKELGARSTVVDLVDCVGFLEAKQNAQTKAYENKIIQYSDDRVDPWGVVSLKQRFLDLRRRYDNHKQDTKERDEFESSLQEIEAQIFKRCRIKPEDVTNNVIKPFVEELKSFGI